MTEELKRLDAGKDQGSIGVGLFYGFGANCLSIGTLFLLGVISAELCRLPQFDGISLRVMQTSEAPNVGIRFRVFDLNSCRS